MHENACRINWVDGQEEDNCATSVNLIRTAEIGPESTVLEIGCGLGQLCGEIAYLSGAQTFGMDSGHITVEKARAVYPAVTFLYGYAHAIPFSEPAFDVVILHQEVLSEALHASSLFSAVIRILKPSGKLLILADTEEQALQQVALRYFPSLIRLNKNGTQDEEQIMSDAQRIGLHLLCSHVVGAGNVIKNLSFLKKIRHFGALHLHQTGEKEYIEGLLKIEEDYFGHPSVFSHGGTTLSVFVKDVSADNTLSLTA